MNETEIAALLSYRQHLRRGLLRTDDVYTKRKIKKHLSIIEDLLYYDKYSKGVL